MNREDIIRIATSAGIDVSIAESNIKILERFAALVAAHVREAEFKPDWNTYRNGVRDGAEEEREECAKVCEINSDPWGGCSEAVSAFDKGWSVGANKCAELIRARGEL